MEQIASDNQIKGFSWLILFKRWQLKERRFLYIERYKILSFIICSTIVWHKYWRSACSWNLFDKYATSLF